MLITRTKKTTKQQQKNNKKNCINSEVCTQLNQVSNQMNLTRLLSSSDTAAADSPIEEHDLTP